MELSKFSNFNFLYSQIKLLCSQIKVYGSQSEHFFWSDIFLKVVFLALINSSSVSIFLKEKTRLLIIRTA